MDTSNYTKLFVLTTNHCLMLSSKYGIWRAQFYCVYAFLFFKGFVLYGVCFLFWFCTAQPLLYLYIYFGMFRPLPNTTRSFLFESQLFLLQHALFCLPFQCSTPFTRLWCCSVLSESVHFDMTFNFQAMTSTDFSF